MEPGGRRNSEGTCLHKVSAAVSAPTKSYLHQVRCAHCSGIYARQINEEVVYMALFATSSTHQLASEFKTSEYSAFRFSLVPRHRGGGEERAPGIHCLRMRLIPWRPCSYVYVCICWRHKIAALCASCWVGVLFEFYIALFEAFW